MDTIVFLIRFSLYWAEFCLNFFVICCIVMYFVFDYKQFLCNIEALCYRIQSHIVACKHFDGCILKKYCIICLVNETLLKRKWISDTSRKKLFAVKQDQNTSEYSGLEQKQFSYLKTHKSCQKDEQILSFRPIKDLLFSYYFILLAPTSSKWKIRPKKGGN